MRIIGALVVAIAVVACGGPDTVSAPEPVETTDMTDDDNVVRDAGADGQVINGCRIGPTAECPGANLSGADLSGANLEYANLYGATLQGADLRHASLGQANLGDADLSGTKLQGADLGAASLSGTNFEGCSGHWRCE